MPSCVISFQNGQIWKGLFISRYVTRARLFGSRRDIGSAKFAELSRKLQPETAVFVGFRSQTNSAHGRSTRVTQRVNCRFVTRKAVQPTEDAISNYECTFYEAASLPSFASTRSLAPFSISLVHLVLPGKLSASLTLSIDFFFLFLFFFRHLPVILRHRVREEISAARFETLRKL